MRIEDIVKVHRPAKNIFMLLIQKIDCCTHNEILLEKSLPFIAYIAEGQHDAVHPEQNQIGSDDERHRHNGEDRLEQHQETEHKPKNIDNHAEIIVAISRNIADNPQMGQPRDTVHNEPQGEKDHQRPCGCARVHHNEKSGNYAQNSAYKGYCRAKPGMPLHLHIENNVSNARDDGQQAIDEYRPGQHAARLQKK